MVTESCEIPETGEVAPPPTPGEGHIDDGGGTSGEQRAAPRFTLLLRSAKLIADGREYLCVLRDASATGVKLRLFHPLPACNRLELEFAAGERVAIEPVWCSGDHCGFRFAEPVDIGALVTGPIDPLPRRQLRLSIVRRAVLHAHGRMEQAELLNLSQHGACIRSGEHLLLRESVRLEMGPQPAMFAPIFAPRFAKICWRRAPYYGLVFDKGFQLDELARVLAWLQDGSGDDGLQTVA